MSVLSIPESRSASLPATPDPRVVEPAPPTPLFTRHMLGAIEADRDRRQTFRATHRRLRRAEPVMAHPRIAAALATTSVTARPEYRRWADEGGRFDPEAAARLRIGDRPMKRCGS